MLIDLDTLQLDGIYLCQAAGAVRLGQTEMQLYEDPTHPDAPTFAVDSAAPVGQWPRRRPQRRRCPQVARVSERRGSGGAVADLQP